MTLHPSALIQHIKRDITIRTGLVVAGSALVALLLLSFIYWLILVQRLEARIENSLTQRHATAIANSINFSDEERRLFQQFRKSLPVRDEGVYAWLDESGNIFSSSVTGVDCRSGFYDGWLDVSKSAINRALPLVPDNLVDKDVHDRFRFLANKHDEKCLIFGQSMYEVDALQDSVSGSFKWLVPLCLLPPILFSLIYSMSMRKRLQKFGVVLDKVAGGELDARITVDGDDDLDRLAGSANKSFNRLQDSVNTLQQLSSVIAHDLRGPLNRVSNPLDEAIRANEAGKVAKEPLYEVREGLEDARSVFDALLRITQIESGRRRLQFKQVDLITISEELYEVYEAVVEDSGRTLELDLPGQTIGAINGDAELLRQAIVNLVENAIRYTPEGAQIRIGVSLHSKYVQLFVSDNGPGVPEKERERVVQRLYRYKDSTRGKQGHGLGLSLVKAIAELHHGTFVLEDAQPGLKACLKLK